MEHGELSFIVALPCGSTPACGSDDNADRQAAFNTRNPCDLSRLPRCAAGRSRGSAVISGKIFVIRVDS